jgi:hypothetical protein
MITPAFSRAAARSQLTHGMHGTREYESWHGMIQRCTNPNHTAYKNYGGRGIKVCRRWRKFENFFADLGARPPQQTLDRWPNKNGDYAPKNCRWATKRQQEQNTRRNRLFSLFGKTQCVSAWAREWGLSTHQLWQRLDRGWPLVMALSVPFGHQFPAEV